MADDVPRSGLKPMHPGELLRAEILPALKAAGVPRTEVAASLGLSRRAFYDLLEEKVPVTPEMAVKLGALLGHSAELWSNLQQAFDLARAREKLAGQLPTKLEYEGA